MPESADARRHRSARHHSDDAHERKAPEANSAIELTLDRGQPSIEKTGRDAS
jgi:hypothetical protein